MAFPFDLPQIDINRYCCADPVAGGCSHSITEHTGEAGECRGVFGCTCTGFTKHRARCIHQPTEVTADDEA